MPNLAQPPVSEQRPCPLPSWPPPMTPEEVGRFNADLEELAARRGLPPLPPLLTLPAPG